MMISRNPGVSDMIIHLHPNCFNMCRTFFWGKKVVISRTPSRHKNWVATLGSNNFRTTALSHSAKNQTYFWNWITCTSIFWAQTFDTCLSNMYIITITVCTEYVQFIRILHIWIIVYMYIYIYILQTHVYTWNPYVLCFATKRKRSPTTTRANFKMFIFL